MDTFITLAALGPSQRFSSSSSAPKGRAPAAKDASWLGVLQDVVGALRRRTPHVGFHRSVITSVLRNVLTGEARSRPTRAHRPASASRCPLLHGPSGLTLAK